MHYLPSHLLSTTHLFFQLQPPLCPIAYNLHCAFRFKLLWFHLSNFFFTGCGTAFDFHKTTDYLFLVGMFRLNFCWHLLVLQMCVVCIYVIKIMFKYLSPPPPPPPLCTLLSFVFARHWRREDSQMFQGLLKPVLDYLPSTFFVHGFVAAFIVAKRQYSFTSYFQSLQHGATHVYFCLTCLKTFLTCMS